MTKGRKFSAGAPWETVVAASGAVRADRLVEVSGTMALDEQGHSAGIADGN